jgi:hypothetical protein
MMRIRGINNSFLLHFHRYYVFHLDIEMIVLDGDLTFKELDKHKDKWANIKSKIKIDLDLG